MPELKIGIQLASLRQPFKKAIQTAAQLGAHAVEIDGRGEINAKQLSGTGLRHIRKMLDDLNLRVCAVSFHTRRGYDVAEDLDARIAATKDAMNMAYDLGAPVVVNQIGRIPAESEGQSWNTMLHALSDLGQHGQRTGAWLAAETGTESGEDLARMIAALPDGSIGVNLDPGNLIVNGFSASDAVRVLGPHIMHVHARDGVRDLAQGRGLEVPLGRGSTDFPELLATLEEHGYRGYFTIERERSDNVVSEIGQAVQYLSNI